MAAQNSQHKQKNKAIPPKRGQIKAQIFESFVETVSSIFSPKILLGETDDFDKISIKGNDGGGGGGDDSDDSSNAATLVSSTSPPPRTA
ncbi:hypothetical protein RND71_021010 [Anisodus tanguticus]|uniref:Uncharacterized protein n=1 Tax=Anisodus tanguticus TaxID=243964 RepID=A0AAE1VCF5_9SOLA|nr:hypothetical protein RND71_021010 [Anisodus tanguticus]